MSAYTKEEMDIRWQMIVAQDSWFRTYSEYCTLHEPPASPTLFMVDSPCDDAHLQSNSKAECLWLPPAKKRLRNDLPKHPEVKGRPIDRSIVAKIVTELPACEDMWTICAKMSECANEYSFYDGAIKTAAHLIHMLFTEDMVTDYRPQPEVQLQFNKLCDQISDLVTKKKCSCDDICKAIVSLVSDKESNSALTEHNVDLVALYFIRALSESFPFYPPSLMQPLDPPSDGNKQVVDYVSGILSGLDLSGSLTVDEYTRILILIVRGRSAYVGYDLFNRLSEQFIATDAVQKLKDGMHLPMPSNYWQPENLTWRTSLLSNQLTGFVEIKLRFQLRTMTDTFVEIGKSFSVSVADYDLLEVIEVAEVRRHALGEPFICRKHFVWAFYECGYGLPSNIREFNIVDKDHPPYHIYMTAAKLAASLGAKELKLEHFIFAVLYTEDMMIDGKLDAEMHNYFPEFLTAATLDLNTRPRTSPRCYFYLDYVKELDLEWMNKKPDSCDLASMNKKLHFSDMYDSCDMDQDSIALGSSL